MRRRDGLPADVRDRATAFARTIEAGLGVCTETHVLEVPRGPAGDARILDRIASLEQAEGVIKELVANLSNTLASFRTQIVSLRQALAPINKLPVELLQRIFFMGYIDIELPLWRDLHVRTICSVCRLWRAIATSQSELWTTVSLDSSQPYVRLCVERAGTQQFDVTHTTSMQRSDTSPNAWVFRQVCPFTRWNSLNITFREESASWKVFQKGAPHLSHLKKLTIEMYPCPVGRTYRKEELLEIYKLFPNLTSLYILWLPRRSLKFAFSPSLVDLRIDMDLSTSDLATIFEECLSLERLWISAVIPTMILDDGFDWSSAEGRSFRSTTLASLVVSEDVDIGNLRTIVQRLEAPNLKEFCILMDANAKPDGSVLSDGIANLLRRIPDLTGLAVSANLEFLYIFAESLSVGARSTDASDSGTHAEAADSRMRAPLFLPRLLDLELTYGSSLKGDPPFDVIKEHIGDFLCAVQIRMASQGIGGWGKKLLRTLRISSLGDADYERLCQIAWTVHRDGDVSSARCDFRV